ncbi:hypothetical protein KR084_002209 [Drosophila pseudotakahashii]|nr:hypothetical protein KR084_002209 [Drosophila pseudotakahashii]
MFLSQHIAVLLLWLCFAILSGEWSIYICSYTLVNISISIVIFVVHGNPLRWGPASNTGPIGGPAWNGGDESTDNIIIHSKGNSKWRY